MNIDRHPLRYSELVKEIERILFWRALDKKLEGQTLETAIEIAGAIIAIEAPGARITWEKSGNRIVTPISD